MLVRLMDLLKVNGINAIFTSLTSTENTVQADMTVDAVSSLADTWIKVQNAEMGAGRKRSLLIVKSRGMGHYNDVCEFSITGKGVQLKPTKN
jgi:circadian clock protein KaiC